MSRRQRLLVRIQAGLVTVACLIGGLLLGIVLGEIVFNALPGHSIDDPDPIHIALAATMALAGITAGGALWGQRMGLLAGSGEARRMAAAGALGFAPFALAAGLALNALEPFAVGTLSAQFPIHRIFTLLFVPAAGLVAAAGGWAIGAGLRSQPLAWGLAWRAGLAAAVAFLLADLTMEALGWRVGGPNAAERLTMLSVMLVSNTGAALAGGAAIGHRLNQSPPTP
jgi:hypothetical protein